MDKNILVKFINSFKRKDKSQCWIWEGGKNKQGYGELYYKNKSYRAHRFSYEYFTGKKIPRLLTIDHLCRNTSCVNPNHLECVSLYENLMRGEGVGAKSARKTYCDKGHPLTKDNLYVYKTKKGRMWRYCLICKRRNQREWRARLRKKANLMKV